jgi:hypothetical protein
MGHADNFTNRKTSSVAPSDSRAMGETDPDASHSSYKKPHVYA